MTKNYRDARTGQYTTAADAAARPAETVAEAVSYRKKPVTIEARQFDGTNAAEIAAWCGGKVESATCHGDGPPYLVVIDTLEGRMVAGRDDYVIRGVKGEFYPCKPDIFAATYEPAEARHTPTETPDVAELRRLAEACPMPYNDPDILNEWYELEDLTGRNYPIPPIDAAFIVAASPAVVLGLLDRLAHMTEARDNARAEVERLTALLAEVRETAEHYYGQGYANGSAAVLRILGVEAGS